MKDQNQNSDTENQNQDNENAKNAANPQGDAKPKYFEDLPQEGGKRPSGNEPAKGGRFGNASIEDGGTVEGSGTGSR